jgi:hypothetical protein
VSRTTLHVRTCDRCGFSTEPSDSPYNLAGWGSIGAEARPLDRDGRDRRIGTDDLHNPEDICPGCVEELFAWWLSRGEVAQPAPPATPPPPSKPTISLVARKQAIAIAAAALQVRVAFALRVVRDEPTAILSGEMIPGALFGLEDTAERLVDGVLDALGVKGYRRRLEPTVVPAPSPTPRPLGGDEAA